MVDPSEHIDHQERDERGTMPEIAKTISVSQEFSIADLSNLVRTGRIRIPEFQRSFRWDASDVLSLFDSILRGYPFGSFLLWKRSAPAAELTIGAIRVSAEERDDALWVVDGQQRITTLVNAVDVDAAQSDERFRLYYSLANDRLVGSHDLGSDLAIPLPDLFDFGRALGWLSLNPDAAPYANRIQSVTAILNGVKVSASVVEQADERVLRDIFDRINSRGRRLNGAEIFDAIHSSASGDRDSGHSLGAIASRIDQETSFGVLDTQIVVQALLVRRHPDITRDVHSEFHGRRADAAFPNESETDAYLRTEEALIRTIRFLQNIVGVPHLSFIPFRFQLLVLVRFFALFESPERRNLELLSRWLWRSSITAATLGLTGSTGDVRSLASNVKPGEESKSVQRLLTATTTREPLQIPDIAAFRTNHSGGKVILSALWARRPVDPGTGRMLSKTDLVTVLESDTSPTGIALEIFPRSSRRPLPRTAANYVIAIQGRHDFVGSLSVDTDLHSLLLDDDLLRMIEQDQREEFIANRSIKLNEFLFAFLTDRTGDGLEATPPLAAMNLDADDLFPGK